MSDKEKDLFSEYDSQPNDQGSPADVNGQPDFVPPAAEQSPAWYQISYGPDGRQIGGPAGYMPIPEKRPRRRFGARIALMAAFLAICILGSGLAGFGGYWIADMLRGTVSDNGGYRPNSSSGGITTGEIYSSVGADGYDYGRVTISQNSGIGLETSKNGSAGSSPLSLIEAIATVKASVVEIATTTVSNRGQLSQGAGSGVIIHADGLIVTNHHVIAGVDTIYVRLINGNTYEAYLRGSDEENDIAVLKIMPIETLTVAKLGCSAALAVGETVFAIGNPLGELGGTVTDGIISATQRDVEIEEGIVMTLLQTNAAINAGNSGGGLFNLAGELVGVVNAKYSATGVEGLGFAIPTDAALVSINALIAYGYIPGRPSLGVELSETNVWLYGRPTSIPYVYDARDSEQLKDGDYIYKIGGVEVTSLGELKRALRNYRVGDTISMTVYRGKNWVTVEVTAVEDVPIDTSVNFPS